MPFKVLVVDDSSFYRRRVREILNQDPNLEVIGEASNGRAAVDQMHKLQPDVITMDVEMPVMDGISAVRQIMKRKPTPILMFSSITQDGAEATISALEAGALDFLPKNFEDIAKDRRQACNMLRAKVKCIAGKRMSGRTAVLKSPGRTTATQKFIKSSSLLSTPAPTRTVRRNYKLMAIGSSTGGPVALQNILSQLAANFPLPILLVQHMPGTFTSAFAQRLNGMCKIGVSEGKDGDVLRPGHAYLAPGGKQMLVEGNSSMARLRIIDCIAGEDHTYKPSVDLTFQSLSKIFHGDVLGIILTGMGADGRDGCKLLKSKGATIWAQDKASSVVYGMPQAVASAGISEKSLALDLIASEIITATRG